MTERPAPQLLFDDGSRVIQQAAATTAAGPRESARGSILISKYYEIDRLASEIVQLVHQKRELQQQKESGHDDDRNDDWFARVALQFPDELLSDSPEVCWAMEDALEEKQQQQFTTKKPSLVFCLGDTTFGPCCPDEVAAQHLKADALVHYGHACLSHPPMSLPVLYGFGVTEHWDTQSCVDALLRQANIEGARRLLLLYQVQYQHAMEELQTQLSERGEILLVAGEIPQEPLETLIAQTESDGGSKESCCGGAGPCAPDEGKSANPEHTEPVSRCQSVADCTLPPVDDTFLVGGLRIPKKLDFSSFTVVFIGDHDSSKNSKVMRQYMNTILWYLSAKTQPLGFWTYSPAQKTLQTSIPPGVQRQLNRRFYLIQKARDASVFGILIGTLSQRYFRSVVHTLRNVIQENGRSSYTFAMGKVNPAKIANFAEIECFIMVACAETSWLDEGEQREMHVPIITPLELHMALGSGGPEVQWGECDYSLDYTDFLLKYRKHFGGGNLSVENSDEVGATPTCMDDAASDQEDAPYYSLITGKYESSRKSTAEGIDLKALPGKGQLAVYKSEAAEFLKKREYKGLETHMGETEVRAAISGQKGIASKYNNDLEFAREPTSQS